MACKKCIYQQMTAEYLQKILQLEQENEDLKKQLTGVGKSANIEVERRI